jgi:recombination protein RecA
MGRRKAATKGKGKGAKDSEKALEDTLSKVQDDLNKSFGDASVMRLNDGALSKIDHWVSSRSMVVDSVLRAGRPEGSSLVPFGRQMEISGPEDSGKTTLCAQIAAETQAAGGLVLITDTEEKLAEDYWTALGVDTGKILYIRATDLEDVFDKQYMAMQIARKAASDRKVLLIWDSLGGTAGAEMIDPESDESPMTQAKKFGMQQAKVISDGMSLINTIVSKTRVCYLFTNHEYQKIGVTYGNKRETRGGGKPKYFATVRLQLTPVGRIKEKDEFSAHDREIGKQVRVKALKNHMGGMLLERDAIIVTGRGFVDSYTVFDIAKTLKLMTGKGWVTWKTPKGEEVKFQGWRGFEKVVVPHAEYPALCDTVRAVL